LDVTGGAGGACSACSACTAQGAQGAFLFEVERAAGRGGYVPGAPPEDDDDDAEAAEDWAAAHPDRVTEEAGADAELDANMEREGVAGGDDESAENAAMHEIPGT